MGLSASAARMDTLQVRFEEVPHEPMGARVLALDLVQLRGDEEVGGQRLLLKTGWTCAASPWMSRTWSTTGWRTSLAGTAAAVAE